MDYSELVERISRSVVAVLTRVTDIWGFEEGRSFGTAFSAGGGLYITAHHVVSQAESIVLATPDGEVAEAHVVAADPGDDLAVLASDLRAPQLALGSALRLRVGEPVLALGYPLAMLDRPTATLGIVSAVGRSLALGDKTFEFLIQTDAAINPGNSGGPLVNSRGEAVGINTAIIAGAQGIGFAIPIDLASIAIEILRRYGRYVRPAIGVYVAAVNKAMAAVYKLPVEQGLLVLNVAPGSPAEEMGLRRGDIIIEADGDRVSNVFQLRLAIARAFVEGRAPKFKIARGNKRIELP
ncbi:S1C family serine protease [Thermoproteus tenax]|uniref:Serine protease n=1 Tax=Thermoproteus tenax (strain ATCC 35583 / DSM 2078 / JCM 9277 / NBRC 100435 / Kra 1) TaxID=768679 RepID=G4RNL0_THETK|nr:trypsin-like peptidase domain-containing protein [Thermoproteus tenax]CCC81154.1 serine protease [Thermoproteus tenax Kra 1]